MAKKSDHKLKLIEYLSDPGNEYPTRLEMATKVLKITQQTFYSHFTPQELSKIEAEALTSRRDRYAPELSKADKALLRRAAEGDPAACKLVYQRFENWSEKHTQENTGSTEMIIRVVDNG